MISSSLSASLKAGYMAAKRSTPKNLIASMMFLIQSACGLTMKEAWAKT